jgi:hypothetical protein
MEKIASILSLAAVAAGPLLCRALLLQLRVDVSPLALRLGAFSAVPLPLLLKPWWLRRALLQRRRPCGGSRRRRRQLAQSVKLLFLAVFWESHRRRYDNHICAKCTPRKVIRVRLLVLGTAL